MILNDKDYENIAAQIEEGENCIEYEKDDEILVIDYVFETDGYIEDDYACGGYMRGTGGWVETSRNLYIESAKVVTEDGLATPVKVDKRLLESFVA